MENNISEPLGGGEVVHSTELKGWKQLMKESFELFKKRAWGLYGTMLIPVLAIIIGVLVIGVVTFLFGLLAGSYAALIVVPLIIIGVVLAMYVLIWAQLASYYYVSNENVKVMDSYKLTKGSLRDYIWLIMLSSLVVLGGFLLFIIPGIIISLWVMFAVFVFVVEKEKGMNSLLRSYSYTKGRWAAIFLKFLPLMILYGVVMFVAESILGKDNPGVGIVSFLIAPFNYFYMYKLYLSAKDSTKDLSYDEGKRKLFKGLAIFTVVATVLLLVGIVGALLYLTIAIPSGGF
jgi:hypothetical protein